MKGMPSPRPGAITAFGDRPQLMADPDDDTGKRQLLVIRSTQALRYTTKVMDKEEVRNLSPALRGPLGHQPAMALSAAGA